MEQCCFIFESQTTHVNMLRQHLHIPLKKIVSLGLGGVLGGWVTGGGVGQPEVPTGEGVVRAEGV